MKEHAMSDPKIELPAEITREILEISQSLAYLAEAANRISPTAGWTSSEWDLFSLGFRQRDPASIIDQLHELSDSLTTDIGTLVWRMEASGDIGKLIQLLENMLEMTEILSASPTRPELQRSARIWREYQRDLKSALTQFGEDVVQTALDQAPPWPPYVGAGKHTIADPPDGYPGPEFSIDVVLDIIRPVNAVTVALLGIEIAVQDLVFSRETAPDDEFPLYCTFSTATREYCLEVYQDRIVISVWESGAYRGSSFPITERELREQIALILADVMVGSRQPKPPTSTGVIVLRD